MLTRRFLIVSTLSASAALASIATIGCAAGSDDTTDSTEAALTTLAPAQCATPTTTEGPLKDSSGQAIAGSGKTTLDGCIVGHADETGAALVTRLGTLLSDTARFGTVEDSPGHALFSRFTPGAATGSLAAGLVQDVDVTLNEQYNPATKLRFTRKKTADGGISISIVNVTALVANVFFGVTVIQPNNLSVTLTFSPQANGVTAKGSSQVIMDQGQDHAAEVAGLVKSVFGWVSDQAAH
jgi:hypothetical protein